MANPNAQKDLTTQEPQKSGNLPEHLETENMHEERLPNVNMPAAYLERENMHEEHMQIESVPEEDKVNSRQSDNMPEERLHGNSEYSMIHIGIGGCLFVCIGLFMLYRRPNCGTERDSLCTCQRGIYEEEWTLT